MEAYNYASKETQKILQFWGYEGTPLLYLSEEKHPTSIDINLNNDFCRFENDNIIMEKDYKIVKISSADGTVLAIFNDNRKRISRYDFPKGVLIVSMYLDSEVKTIKFVNN